MRTNSYLFQGDHAIIPRIINITGIKRQNVVPNALEDSNDPRGNLELLFLV